MRLVRIGTRGSALARWQSDHVAARLRALVPGIEIAITEIASVGDQVTDVPLSHVEGTGFFTTTIEQALIADTIDVAVHSYKDLPVESTIGLQVAASPERGPVEDVLCAREGATLSTLPVGARVGTCSTRRAAQVLAVRPDVTCESLRGNVPTRVEKVTSGALDAVVLARAGVTRLGLTEHITEVFPVERVLPAPAQGALALQCRAADDAMIQLLARLDHAQTRRAVLAERTMLRALGGGCSVPVGGYATVHGDEVVLAAGVFGLSGRSAVRVTVAGRDPHAVGEEAARQLLARGADRVLAEFEKTARIDTPVMSEAWS